MEWERYASRAKDSSLEIKERLREQIERAEFRLISADFNTPHAVRTVCSVLGFIHVERSCDSSLCLPKV